MVTCSPHGHWVDDASTPAWQPSGVAHARQDDTQMTFCGLSTLSWSVFWELPLDDITTTVCGECAHTATRVAQILTLP